MALFALLIFVIFGLANGIAMEKIPIEMKDKRIALLQKCILGAFITIVVLLLGLYAIILLRY